MRRERAAPLPRQPPVNLVVYGPPGSGKSTIGRLAARQLGREFVDGDARLEAQWGRAVTDYFAAGDLALFREREAVLYRGLAERDDLVLAPGGGALLSPHIRAAVERSGVIICLTASFATLVERLERSPNVRSLLADDLPGRLAALLNERAPLYQSFAIRVSTDGRATGAVAAEVVAHFSAAGSMTQFSLGSTLALYGRGLLARLSDLLTERGLTPPFLMIGDARAAELHGDAARKDLDAPLETFDSGEANKSLATVQTLYAACVRHGLERGGTVLALDDGVARDIAGFVAATFMRGVAWVNLPTTVLAMADASLGGKVAVDLPEGKNLVGAFHPPQLVLADFDVLATLPDIEVRCGLAEIFKSGLIGDAGLFEALLNGGLPLEAAILRAAAVKIGIVNADPHEHGERATLNLGHTIGHGVETASGLRLRHGEAVAIGLAAETRLAENLGLAEKGLTGRVSQGIKKLGLPQRCPGMAPETILSAMATDKKKAGGRLTYALPRRPGEVLWGQTVSADALLVVLEELTHAE